MSWPPIPDDELFSIVDRELVRQKTTLQLIASENFASPAVLLATGSVLTNKYSEGYPGKRYYGGNEIIDEVEDLARDRAKALFGAEHANVQPHSGANANLAAYLGLLELGDTVLGLRLDQGGHLTHGSPVNASSKLYRFVSYGVTPSDERIDLDQVRDLAKAERPKLIVTGATAYPRIIDPKPFRDIADEVGALFLFDAAHVAGLIAGGVHPNPVPYADVVTFTTHKTLRGPRSGAILCTSALAEKIDKAVFPGFQGGPLDHVVAAKAVAFHEAAQPEFSHYAQQVITNAAALAKGLAEKGLRLVSGGTDNHLMLVDLQSFDTDLSGKKARTALDKAGISLNENTVPDDPRPPYLASGLRIGTPATTTQGMGEPEMATIATLIDRVLRNRDDENELAAVRDEVLNLCSKFPRVLNSYVIVFAAAALTTFVLTPVVRRAVIRVGWVIPPGERKVHATPLPTVGGAAMFAGLLVALGVAWRLDDFSDVFDSSTAPLGIVAASAIVFLTGTLDEARKVSGDGVSAPAKMAGLVLAGSVLSFAGVSTIFFRVPFLGIFSLTPDLSAFITVLWVVGMANAINLIDGLDGLAAGIMAIASFSFFLYADRLAEVDVLAPGNIGALLAIITCGICVGFLPHNVHPAKIIMGDCGALLLGVLMAASTMAVGGSTDAQYSGQSFFFFAPLFIPLVILGVPIIDTAFAIVRRATKRSGLATADKEHLHHRLMRLGHGQRRSVLILWGWTALLSALVLYPTYTGRGDAVVPIGIAALGLVLFTVFHPGVRRARNGDAADDLDDLEDAGEPTDGAPIPR